MYEQSYHFTFEAAHDRKTPDREAAGHRYARVHGHSFKVRVTLAAPALTAEGWVMDFAALKTACEETREALDHRFLNDVEGLETPTLEILSAWIFRRLKPALPALARVEIARPTLDLHVVYHEAAAGGAA